MRASKESTPRSPDVWRSAETSPRTAKNLFRLLTVVAAATVISLLLERLSFNESNIIVTYLLGVVFVAYATDGYLYSIAASTVSVLAFKYFFTDPYFTFRTYGRDYPVTFAVMLLAALLASSMTARIKALGARSEKRELRLHFLNRIIRALMLADNYREIADIAAEETAEFLDASVLVAVVDSELALKYRHVVGGYAFDSINDEVACLDALRSGVMDKVASGRFYSSQNAHILPILGKGEVLGLMGVSFKREQVVTDNVRSFLSTVCAQVSFALDRGRMRLTQEQSRVDIEAERLRSNLLRGISHDLRTPLAGILGSAGALRDHYATLDDSTKLGFVREILDEAEWLKHMVENTLYLTRVGEEGIRLRKELQPVEEMVAAAVERIKARVEGVNLRVDTPREFIMVPADATLVVQVLINLLDNALRHAPEGTPVTLRVSKSPPDIVFEVLDRGPGIAPEELGRVFDRFFTGDKAASRKGRQKGVGLGLTVCKSIVEAHGGTISASNNPAGGAAFRFSLPMEKE